LFGGGRFQTLVDDSGPIPRQRLRRVGPVIAIHDSDLLGTPLFRRLPEFGGDGVGIDQFLGEARLDECESHEKSEAEKWFQGWILSIQSEKSGAYVQAVGREKQRYEKADAAKNDDGFERFDVD